MQQLKSWKDSPPQCRHPHSSNLILPIPPHSSEPGLSLTFKIITNFHFSKAIPDLKLRCKSGYPCQPSTLPLSHRFPRQCCTLQGDFSGSCSQIAHLASHNRDASAQVAILQPEDPALPRAELVFLLLTTPLIFLRALNFTSCGVVLL